MAMAVSPPLESSSSSTALSAATERTYILCCPPFRRSNRCCWWPGCCFEQHQNWKCFRKSRAASFFFFFFYAVAMRGSGGCPPKPIGATSARGDRLRGTAVARVHEQGGSLPPRRTCHLQTTSAPTEGRTWELTTTARRAHNINNNITLLGLSSTSVLDAIGKLSGLAPTCSRHTSLQLDLYALSSGRLVSSSFLVEERTHAVF